LWTEIFRKYSPKILVVLEGVITLETFPLWSCTKENLQMYRVSPC